MPERTRDGKWKWGNIKRDSRKELAQTVYGIWKGEGSKGSFHKFYHEGNPYGYKHRVDHKKHVKESYHLNPLIYEGVEVDHILGTITDEREKAFLIAAKKIAKDFSIIDEITRDDNCIYVYLKEKYDEEQKNELSDALDTLVKGFHFGRSDFYPADEEQKKAFFAMGSCPTDDQGDLWVKRESTVTYDQIKEMLDKTRQRMELPDITPEEKQKLFDQSMRLRLLRVKMRRKAITRVKQSTLDKYLGKD